MNIINQPILWFPLASYGKMGICNCTLNLNSNLYLFLYCAPPNIMSHFIQETRMKKGEKTDFRRKMVEAHFSKYRGGKRVKGRGVR